ncbi:hypothetical protein FOTG_19011, partial [Fusarium oxysporum f. sp. vasinfectum 25433]
MANSTKPSKAWEFFLRVFDEVHKSNYPRDSESRVEAPETLTTARRDAIQMWANG